jgi:protein-L-isoaspartate(D-aspartate) O-methyltransferase
MTLEQVRREYAREVCRTADPPSQALEDAFSRVPRERFMNPGPWRILTTQAITAALSQPEQPVDMKRVYELTPDARPEHLYADVLVSIDDARQLNNGQPSGQARWISAVEPKRGESVLHIGCGTGYYAAIFADMVGESGRVVALEVDPELAARAQHNLAPWPQVRVEHADGSELHDTFDVIYVNAGATHARREWLAAMRPGARLFLPLTMHVPRLAGEHGVGAALVITAARGAAWPARMVSPVGIFDCTGARDQAAEAQLREVLTPDVASRIAAVSVDAHERGDRCLVHVDGFCLQAKAA